MRSPRPYLGQLRLADLPHAGVRILSARCRERPSYHFPLAGCIGHGEDASGGRRCWLGFHPGSCLSHSPGLLGSAREFSAFAKRLADRPDESYAPLRRLIQPYLLRRLKTDRSVVADLPDKTEVKAFCLLSGPQAALYQKMVDELERAVAGLTQGIERRGLVPMTSRSRYRYSSCFARAAPVSDPSAPSSLEMVTIAMAPPAFPPRLPKLALRPRVVKQPDGVLSMSRNSTAGPLTRPCRCIDNSASGQSSTSNEGHPKRPVARAPSSGEVPNCARRRASTENIEGPGARRCLA